MNVSLGDRWENFVDRAVSGGRYASASEIVREGLRLVEEREAKLHALQKMIADSLNAYALDENAVLTDDEVGALITARSAALAHEIP